MLILMPEYYIITSDSLQELVKTVNSNGAEIIHIEHALQRVGFGYEAIVFGVKR